ncbi:MAG: hypothetical protein WBH00_04000 [Xanthobacteraceae bacterium]
MNQRALEAGARAVTAAQLEWKAKNGGDKASCIDCPDEVIALAVITAYEAHLKAEGFVVVPRETFFEIANRAGNMSDPDAADWLPSIYRIAMEAAGEDPWPTLRLHGYDPDNLSVSFDTMAKNREARAAAQEPNDADK